MRHFPLAASYGFWPVVVNLLALIVYLLTRDNVYLVSAALLNAIFYFAYKSEEIRATLLISGTSQESENE